MICFQVFEEGASTPGKLLEPKHALRLENRNSGLQTIDFKFPAISVLVAVSKRCMLLLTRCLGRRIQLEHMFQIGCFNHHFTRLAPYNRSKWSYNPYKWPYKWLTFFLFTPISGVMGPYSYLVGAHLLVIRCYQ